MSSDETIERYSCRDEAATEQLGARLAARLPSDVVLLLEGEMGAGKTVLVRGLAQGWGVDRREIQSPTYALIHEHEGRLGPFVHVDLYRLEPDEIDALGLDELLAGPGLKAIEWPDRLPSPPAGALRLQIEVAADGSRRVHVRRSGRPRLGAAGAVG